MDEQRSDSVGSEAAGFPLEVKELRAEISDRRGGRKFQLTHIFKPISEANWVEFSSRTQMVMETKGEKVSTDSNRVEAVAWLWDERITRVEGYGDDLPEDWKARVPFRHKNAALHGLSQCYVAEEDDGGDVTASEDDAVFSLADDEEQVTLEAGRNGQEYTGLIHRFKRPTTKQQKAYSRHSAQGTIVRGRKRGVKEYLGSDLRFLAKLYDELIVKVEGYEPADPAKMDAVHKRVAVEALLGNE